jgi:hypothetical protein
LGDISSTELPKLQKGWLSSQAGVTHLDVGRVVEDAKNRGQLQLQLKFCNIPSVLVGLFAKPSDPNLR